MLLKKIVLHYDNEYGEEEEVQHIGVKLLNEINILCHLL